MKVLLIGDCELSNLSITLNKMAWDKIILRSGFPFGTIELLERYGLSMIEYDGTVRDWEMRNKKN
jgi:hypothetical protein